jgi:hypothetical protein
MKNLTKWKLLRSRFVLNNKWCQVRQDEIELPSGQIIDDFFVNVRPNIALVFATTELSILLKKAANLLPPENLQKKRDMLLKKFWN